jgi:hypothetical protein
MPLADMNGGFNKTSSTIIPSYVMSILLLPETCINEIEKMLNAF